MGVVLVDVLSIKTLFLLLLLSIEVAFLQFVDTGVSVLARVSAVKNGSTTASVLVVKDIFILWLVYRWIKPCWWRQ